jgi:hypothetical protein
MKISRKYTPIFLIAVILVILIIYSVFHYYTAEPHQKWENFENPDPEEEFGFIMNRHVSSELTNKLWKTCVKSIRKFYPNEKIIIIDDNSNYDFITDDDVDLTRCEVLDSEFKKRGELLPYYYLYKRKWFRRAIFLHDSAFINSKFDMTDIGDVKFLWHIDGGQWEDREKVRKLLSKLKNKDELVQLLDNPGKWKGCFGVMSIIDYDFLKYIMEKYNMPELLNHVNTRENRMAFERVFGIICITERPELLENPSIFGNINENKNNRNSYTYSYDEYIEDLNQTNIESAHENSYYSESMTDNDMMNNKINKIFVGR